VVGVKRQPLARLWGGYGALGHGAVQSCSPACIYHSWFFVRNIQGGGVGMTLPPMARHPRGCAPRGGPGPRREAVGEPRREAGQRVGSHMPRLWNRLAANRDQSCSREALNPTASGRSPHPTCSLAPTPRSGSAPRSPSARAACRCGLPPVHHSGDAPFEAHKGGEDTSFARLAQTARPGPAT
jgi:hypothetical protein